MPAPPVDWTLDKSVAPYVPTPLVTARGLFLWSDRGVVTCVDAATGEIRWRGRVGDNYFASPVSLGDAVLDISGGDSFSDIYGMHRVRSICLGKLATLESDSISRTVDI